MPPRNFYAISLTAIVCLFCHAKAITMRNGLLVGDAITLIESYYVDEVNQRELVEGAMQGLTSKLDPYTQFIPPTAYEAFQDTLQQHFAGIGILIEQPADKPVRVITPLVDSPALKAGFLPGDEIIAVNGEDTTKLRMDAVGKLLRGPIGSMIDVRVRRSLRTNPTEANQADADADGQPATEELVLRVARAEIELESVIGDYRDANDRWVYRLADRPEIAYVRLTGFGEKTADELKQVFRGLNDDTRGLILDLRGNSGGLLSSAVDVCDMFLDSGRIVSTRGRGVLDPKASARAQKDQITWEATSGTLVPPDLPVSVLIDGDSASASEIVAACLKDHGRVTVVGERSFGKGSVQNVFALENGRSALKLTTSRYYRPNGHNIHREEEASPEDEWGVRPEKGFEVPLNDDQRRQILRRWELATYPKFPQLAPMNGASEAPGKIPLEDPSELSAAEVDPQLRRALEAIPGANPGESPGQAPSSGENQPAAEKAEAA